MAVAHPNYQQCSPWGGSSNHPVAATIFKLEYLAHQATKAWIYNCTIFLCSNSHPVITFVQIMGFNHYQSYVTGRKIAKPRVYWLSLMKGKNKLSDQNQNSIYSIYSDALLLERLISLLIPIGRDSTAAIINLRNRKQNKCQYHWIMLCPFTAAVPRKEMIIQQPK